LAFSRLVVLVTVYFFEEDVIFLYHRHVFGIVISFCFLCVGHGFKHHHQYIWDFSCNVKNQYATVSAVTASQWVKAEKRHYQVHATWWAVSVEGQKDEVLETHCQVFSLIS